MNKTIAAIIAIIVIVGGVFLVMHRSSAPTTIDTNATSASSESINPNAGGTSTTSATFTLAEVAQHADSTSCYSAINGSVYDLTNWISQHPGGEGAILSICGKDGTAAFSGQHGSDPRANQILSTMKIGTLATE